MATRKQGDSSQGPSSAGVDAIAALMADHRRVKALFEEFEEMKEDAEDEEKEEVVRQIIDELTVHATIEEEVFYPAVRQAIEEADLVDEALVEHASAKELIAQLQEMEPGEELYDAKVKVLGEQIDHHVKEEEGEMFAQVRKSKVDTAALGVKLEQRRVELLAELGLTEEDEGDGMDDTGIEDDADSDDEEESTTSTPQKRSASKR